MGSAGDEDDTGVGEGNCVFLFLGFSVVIVVVLVMIDNRVVSNRVCGGGNSGVAGECVLVVIVLLLVLVSVKRRMLMILSYWAQFLHQAFDLGAKTKMTGRFSYISKIENLLCIGLGF